MGEPTSGRGAAVKTMMDKMKGGWVLVNITIRIIQ